MKVALSRLRNIILILLALITVFVIVVILFISPIAKYVLEKYDVKWTGREITMDWAYVNPFTGYIYLSNVKIYEENSDSIALSARGLSGRFSMRPLLHGYYFVNDLTLDHPRWNVIKHKDYWNFTSFIDHLNGPPDTGTTYHPPHFNIMSMKVKEGEFHYRQEVLPITYYIKGGNFSSDGKLIDADSVAFKFFFLSGPSPGSMQGNFIVNFKSKDYHYDVLVHKFDLTPLEQYLKPIANYGTFTGNLDANLKSAGNFRSGEDVKSHGQLAINDFHFGKNRKEDYASFDRLSMAIDELSPINKKYLFDSLLLYHPYFKYEIYDHLDNLQTMFSKTAAPAQELSSPEQFNLLIEIARYVKVLAREFFHSYYKIDNLGIYRADFKYNDYSLSEKFSLAFSPLYVTADSIDKAKTRVNLNIQSGIEPYGNVNVDLSVNPKDTGDFDMQYHLSKMPVALYNPYFITYTSFPLDRGTIEFNGTWNVRGGQIQSTNHLVIIDPRVTRRVKKKDAKWIPLPLVMAFIRERGNVIDYEIPITGNLKKPTFHLHDVLMDLLRNIFIKPPTTPYRMEVKDIENEIEKSLTLKWMMRQNTLTSRQENFLDKIAAYLKKNPDASITVYPQQYTLKEKEYITFYLAKRKYYESLNGSTFAEKDSEAVERMSVRDSSFLKYLKKQVKDSLVFALQEKCSRLVSSNAVNTAYDRLTKEREQAFLDVFKKEGVDNRVKVHTPENAIPYNGFSYFKIDYNGKMPESLVKAYAELDELNEKNPRKEFEEERKKNKAPLYERK